MNTAHLCPNCFKETFHNQVCQSCGFQAASIKNGGNSLPVYTMLNQQYLLGNVIGSGGFGITYKALDIYNRTICAVKEYMPSGIAARSADKLTLQVISNDELGNFQHGKKRFVEEATTLKSLQSVRSTINVVDYFQANGTAYFVMPFLDGSHLKELYRGYRAQNASIPFDFVKDVIITIGMALIQVHENAGLLHRDISPENIMITSKGEPFIIDFGNARCYLSEKSRNMSVLLKPGYAPPEQYSSTGNQGPWTDVYSLAATFYFIVSGKAVPDAPDRLQGAACPMLDTLVPTCPHYIAEVVDHALKLNIKERTQSMREFISGLRTPPPAPQPTQTQPQPAGAPPQQGQQVVGPIPVQKKPYLEVIYGEQLGNKWMLFPDVELKIGRSHSKCNIVLAKYPQVSSLHCVVTYSTEHQRFFLQDVSTNGTALDGKQLTKNFVYQIQPGQQIALASNTCIFRLGLSD